MSDVYRAIAILAVVLAFFAGGCPEDSGSEGGHESGAAVESRGEHDGDGSDHDRDGEGHHGEEGEESSVMFGLNETYDNVRNGARLILTYDAQSNSFVGTVENTTDKVLQQVRVEVHLSNGREIGPTTPGDLGPGEKRPIKLTATSTDFDGWNAHPEVGIGEHGGEHSGEHGGEGRGEHAGDSEHGSEGGEH